MKDEINDQSAQGNSMMAEKDPSKLVDLELINLLKFCQDLMLKHKEAAFQLYQTSGTDGNRENSELGNLYRPNHSVMALVDELGGASAPHSIL